MQEQFVKKMISKIEVRGARLKLTNFEFKIAANMCIAFYLICLILILS
jgi:hypothetical protein